MISRIKVKKALLGVVNEGLSLDLSEKDLDAESFLSTADAKWFIRSLTRHLNRSIKHPDSQRSSKQQTRTRDHLRKLKNGG